MMKTDKGVCTLWHLNKNSGLWAVWIHIQKPHVPMGE
jgi:hypothetical protein